MSKTSSVKIDFAVLTVDRPRFYVHKLISHLRKDLPMRLIVGSPSCGYLNFTGILLFVTVPSLFEHVGDVSTGLSPMFHRAGHFAENSLRRT
jgi:hypothetical protein